MRRRNTICGPVWAIVSVLAVLLVITTSVAAYFLIQYEPGANDIISLTPEDTEKTEYKYFYRPQDPNPGIGMTNGVDTWETKTDIDLFKSSYVSGTGKTTVASANGDKLIAPGTSNLYRFALKNTGNIVLHYTLALSGMDELTNKNIPMQVRLSHGDEWLVGSSDSFGAVADLANVAKVSNLAPGKTDVYILEWCWPFDGGNDAGDVLLGSVSVSTDTAFSMTISTTAEEIPGAVAIDADGKLLYEKVIDPQIFLIVAIDTGILLLLLWLLLWLLWRRRVRISGVIVGIAEFTDPTPAVPPRAWKDYPQPLVGLFVGGREALVTPSGKFDLGKVRTGDLSLQLTDAAHTATMRWTLRRRANVRGVQVRYVPGRAIVTVGLTAQSVRLRIEADGTVLRILAETEQA